MIYGIAGAVLLAASIWYAVRWALDAFYPFKDYEE